MEVKSLNEYQKLVLGNSNTFVFYYKNDLDDMVNKFNQLSETYSNCRFLRVDLSKIDVPDLKVSPTIKYFVDGKEVDNYSGKSIDKLLLFVSKFFIQKVDDHEMFEFYKNNFNGLIVVDFTATWCGPCKTIIPYYHELNDQFNNVLFLKIDVDDNEETTHECDISSMPTFQFYKNQEKITQFSGADRNKLLNLIEANN
jgi:thioredoxin 1